MRVAAGAPAVVGADPDIAGTAAVGPVGVAAYFVRRHCLHCRVPLHHLQPWYSWTAGPASART